MKKILFPEDWGNFPTLYDMWYNVTEGEISPLGSGSDYASFYQNGIGCVRTLLPSHFPQPFLFFFYFFIFFLRDSKDGPNTSPD